jgi:hypothetical protein
VNVLSNLLGGLIPIHDRHVTVHQDEVVGAKLHVVCLNVTLHHVKCF